MSPQIVQFCPCGKTKLEDILNEERKSCLEPIATCTNRCERQMKCGPIGANHSCSEPCHEKGCPPCPQMTKVRCRCGAMDREVPCKDLSGRADDVLCDKRCQKRKSCLKHKCGRACCIDIDHICTSVCSRLLSCGTHRCDDACHRGNCRTCPNVSFDELPCQCGSQIAFPPIPCGTKPPLCDEPCTRNHQCSHTVRHNCHSDAQCPPCTELTEKWCHGKHELRKSIVCHLEGYSCGNSCGLPLPCGNHNCIEPCHAGPCLKVPAVESSDSDTGLRLAKSCTQPCKKIRDVCGHICRANCHEGSCPRTPCNEKVYRIVSKVPRSD